MRRTGRERESGHEADRWRERVGMRTAGLFAVAPIPKEMGSPYADLGIRGISSFLGYMDTHHTHHTHTQWHSFPSTLHSFGNGYSFIC